jgi:hypothetical protein
MARSDRQPPKAGPERLTALLPAFGHMWLKLMWERDRLNAARIAKPFDADALIFGALNFAITAQSLEEWVWPTIQAKRGRKNIDLVGFKAEVAAAVPMQPAFRDIANTAKHGTYRDENWAEGTVELSYFSAFSGTDREFVLFFHGANNTATTNLEVFDQVTNQWMDYLISQGLGPGKVHSAKPPE